jgi:hypothetical protein
LSLAIDLDRAQAPETNVRPEGGPSSDQLSLAGTPTVVMADVGGSGQMLRRAVICKKSAIRQWKETGAEHI